MDGCPMTNISSRGDIWTEVIAVRLRMDELSHCDWRCDGTFTSSFVEQDASGAKCAGFTEWSSSFRGRPISLCWDWYQSAGGEIYLLETVPARSNLNLIDEQGYDLNSNESDSALMQFLRESNFWHIAVSDAIAAGLEDQSYVSLSDEFGKSRLKH